MGDTPRDRRGEAAMAQGGMRMGRLSVAALRLSRVMPQDAAMRGPIASGTCVPLRARDDNHGS
ncbi:hypothetical protein D1F64_11125 [Breoghania sp. L-A4]|nr:hypothetical protein D1F64_11125 [Breoghania sp. L-A4]